MGDRAVFTTRKDSDGDILAVGNSGASWSRRSKHDVIVDIELGMHTYHVPWPTGDTEIRVEFGSAGKYLRTDRDETSRNNLLDLPNL